MEKEFIPYEQALALKELGFDKDCVGYYDGLGNPMVKPMKHCPISAPLYQQAFRWFREKYDLIACNDYGNNKYFYWIISKDEKFFFDNEDGNRNCIVYNTYEEAELECLKKLIEIVKEIKLWK
jgi:hypothetical protein